MVSAAGDFVYAKFSEINVIIRPSAIFTVKCNDSVSFSLFFFSSSRTKQLLFD